MPAPTRTDAGAALRRAAMRTVKLPPAASEPVPEPEPEVSERLAAVDPTAMRAFLATQGHDPARLAGLDDATIARTVQQVMDRTQQAEVVQGHGLYPDDEAEAEPSEGTMEHWLTIADAVEDDGEAWLVIRESWPEVDAQGTLDLIQRMIGVLGGDDPQDVEEPVDPRELTAKGQRAWLLEWGYDAPLAEMDDAEVILAVDQAARLFEQGVTEPEPAPRSLVDMEALQAYADREALEREARADADRLVAEAAERPARPTRLNPPRPARRPRGRINIADASDDTPAEFRQAMQGDVQLAEPLKTTPPRKASGHKLPTNIAWPRDGRGRRISPEALAAQQRGE